MSTKRGRRRGTVGCVREIFAATAQAIYTERGQGTTWHDLARRAQVGQRVARQTVRDMERAGELVRTEQLVRLPHARRPLVVLLPAAALVEDGRAATRAVEAVFCAWQSGPTQR